MGAEPNSVVGPIHPKAMPVILKTEDEVEAWLRSAETEERAEHPMNDISVMPLVFQQTVFHLTDTTSAPDQYYHHIVRPFADLASVCACDRASSRIS